MVWKMGLNMSRMGPGAGQGDVGSWKYTLKITVPLYYNILLS